ncbi:hypothetical protein AB1N83_003798 [Pleurotus pulmonarius]
MARTCKLSDGTFVASLHGDHSAMLAVSSCGITGEAIEIVFYISQFCSQNKDERDNVLFFMSSATRKPRISQDDIP